MTEGRSESAAHSAAPPQLPASWKLPTGVAPLKVTDKLRLLSGIAAVSPPGGSRGQPVTKRRKARWSAASSSDMISSSLKGCVSMDSPLLRLPGLSAPPLPALPARPPYAPPPYEPLRKPPPPAAAGGAERP
ncbi:hypothetical protein TSOC_004882 [Tetrabaena socialis]|uniref:Uncharacterized protein n=1 Tax=Tetrabaena socialis TaxID=47790 RepID=A0A2J8A7P3_9CHLO|nr:hypothetical protein TSOC_004882 [Tetrabaena socialis]|eukprot:PNH08554.1 hypothetical protein TSOC_004882 [Tetrabaena socialis]